MCRFGIIALTLRGPVLHQPARLPPIAAAWTRRHLGIAAGGAQGGHRLGGVQLTTGIRQAGQRACKGVSVTKSLAMSLAERAVFAVPLGQGGDVTQVFAQPVVHGVA